MPLNHPLNTSVVPPGMTPTRIVTNPVPQDRTRNALRLAIFALDIQVALPRLEA